MPRRPGESVVSVSRVRRRPGHHSPNRSRRGGSRRSRASWVASSSESGGGDAVLEGLRSRGSSRGCFQRGSSCEPLPPRVPGHCQPPEPRFDRRRASSPRHYEVRVYRRSSGHSTRGPHPLGLFRDSSTRSPPPRLRARCARGYAGPFRHPDDGAWPVQLSGPCSALQWVPACLSDPRADLVPAAAPSAQAPTCLQSLPADWVSHRLGLVPQDGPVARRWFAAAGPWSFAPSAVMTLLNPIREADANRRGHFCGECRHIIRRGGAVPPGTKVLGLRRNSSGPF